MKMFHIQVVIKDIEKIKTLVTQNMMIVQHVYII